MINNNSTVAKVTKENQEEPKNLTSKNALQLLAQRLNLEPATMTKMLMATAFKECKTNEQYVAAIVVANTYKLNPLLRELYVFPGKNGGVMPVVPIDGWVSLVQRREDYDGVELIENRNPKGEANKSGTDVDSITAKFYVKGKAHPVIVTEYMIECYDGSKSPWQKWPIRMLRHKAYIQGARIAFGFSGIYDEDEKDRIHAGEIIDIPAPMVSLKNAPEPAKEEAPVNEAIAEDIKEESGEQAGSPDSPETVAETGRPPFVPSSSDVTKVPEKKLKEEMIIMLSEMCSNDPDRTVYELELYSSFEKKDGGMVNGVTDINSAKFKGQWVAITHRKIKEAYVKWYDAAHTPSERIL